MNIPFKTKLPALDQTTLAKRNKVFDSLSEEDKRKEIAFDGLNLVITGQVGAAKGTYWSGAIYDIVVPLKTSKQLQEALNLNLSEDCRVCQRGLMMISQIRLGNSVRPDDVDVDCGSYDNVKGFDMGMFAAMEKEYEISGFDHPHAARTKRKLANICCNVIANGYFNTNDTTDYLKQWGIKVEQATHTITI